MEPKENRTISYMPKEIGFIIIHLSPLLAIWTNVTAFDWIMCVSLYFLRMFFITGGYHRYFSHRTYKTSRWFQWVIAFMAQTSAQKGALWWASHHRDHHKYSDTPKDPHSMKLYGFWYSHIGWILAPEFKHTDFQRIADYAKYPELMWLNKHHLVPPVSLGIFVFVLGGFVNSGWSMELMPFLNGGVSCLLIGFMLSTTILYHGTFSINSIMHKLGKQRYETGDESRNSLILALVTLGEGWHNNHHYYMSSTRQGFFWWEIDITFYILRVFQMLGLVWDLQGVPDHIKHSKSMEEARAKLKNSKNMEETLNEPA